MEISFEEFKKLEMKIGKIIEAEEIAESKNLIKLLVDFGSEKRQAIAGLKKYFDTKDLVGKKFVFVLNLKPVKLMGFDSNCMILAADDGKGSVVLIQPENDIAIGSRVR
jgi:methionyl-tRNA synthetase